MAKLKLNANWQQTVKRATRREVRRTAEDIADDARARTDVRTGAARDSVKVVQSGDDVVVTAGGGNGWHFIFQEFGGNGFRPPPMPLRRAAAEYGRYSDA